MKKNVASQSIGAEMITAADGTAFTGSVSVAVTVDNGTQGAGGGTAPAHEGNGYHSYTPTQAETNGDHVAFTFTGTGAIPATVQVYTTFPQTGDNFARLGAPAGASVSADIADVPTVAEFNARTLAAASYFDPAADTVANVTAVATLTGHTAQTGDSFARLGAPAGASVSADMAAVKVDTAAILVDTGTTLDTKINDIQGATFSSATDSLEAIRDRGDAAWTTGAGGSDPAVLQNTTIATLASQVSFTLTAGSADDDAYNGHTIVIEDQSTATQKAVGTVSDYTGSTKTVTLKADPGIFTMATGDTVDILTASPTLIDIETDTAEIGAAGAGLTAINLPNQTMDITGSLTGSVGSVTGAVGSVAGNVDGSTASVTGAVGSVTGAVGSVTAEVTADVTKISGSATAADNLEASALGIVSATAITGTLSTTQMTTDLTEATDDHYIGRIVVFTSGVLAGQATDITDYTGATKLITMTALTEAPSNTDAFVVV